MDAFHREETALVAAPSDILFAHLDDPERLASHMTRRSWMMAESSMRIATDALHGRAVGSVIRLEGRMCGLALFVEEAVVEHERPRRKVWQTVGDVRLLVLGAYRMGFEITPERDGTRLRVFIDYSLPTSGLGRWRGRIFGHVYASWCVRRMVRDAVEFFADHPHAKRRDILRRRLAHVRVMVEFVVASFLGACAANSSSLRLPSALNPQRATAVILMDSLDISGESSVGQRR